MITELRIEGFRGFRNVDLKGLRRINIIVGDSGSGKTALLEAIGLLAMSSNDYPIQLRTNRSHIFPDPTKVMIEAAVSELMPHMTEAISLGFRGDDGEDRDLRIVPTDAYSLLSALNTNPNRVLPFKLYWKIPGFDEMEYNCGVFNNVIDISHSSGKNPLEGQGKRVDCLSVSYNQPMYDLPLIYSLLEQSGQLDAALAPVLNEFESVEGFRHSQDGSGAAILHVKRKGTSYMLPLHAISSGLANWLRYSLVLAQFKKILLLLDEVENGTYYGKQESLLRMIYKLAKTQDSQIFATTHSYEFLQNLAKVAADNPKDFMLLRTRYDSGECKIEQIPGETFTQTIAEDLEVR